jgi:hypothetical protein
MASLLGAVATTRFYCCCWHLSWELWLATRSSLPLLLAYLLLSSQPPSDGAVAFELEAFVDASPAACADAPASTPATPSKNPTVAVPPSFDRARRRTSTALTGSAKASCNMQYLTVTCPLQLEFSVFSGILLRYQYSHYSGNCGALLVH